MKILKENWNEYKKANSDFETITINSRQKHVKRWLKSEVKKMFSFFQNELWYDYFFLILIPYGTGE